jgi:hypothetical protein
MRADFHLLRQSAVGVCGAALLGFSLGGCVSTHKPRFWDQQDVKNSPDAASSPTAATAATDPTTAPKPAATVIAADHSTTIDSSGHVEAFDVADSPPSAPGAQNAVASTAQPAAPPTPASASNETLAPSVPPTGPADAFNDANPAAPVPKKADAAPSAKDFADSATPAVPSPSPATPTSAASGKDSTTAVVVSSSTGAPKADPFVDGDNPVFVGKGQGQPTAPPAVPQSPAPQDAAPAAPQSSDLFQMTPQESTPQPPGSNVTVSEKGRGGGDPFAESPPIAAPQTPVAPVPMATEGPTCGAPPPTMPSAAAESLPATPAAKQSSTPVAKTESHAPAATEQTVDFEPVVTIPQASNRVIPTSKSTVAAKPETTPKTAKPAVRETPSLAGEESDWTPASGVKRAAHVSDAMIIDSGSVRGRFTGIERQKAKSSRPVAAPQEAPSKPTAEPIASPKPIAVQPTPPAEAPASPTESVPSLDAEGQFAPASPNVPAVGQTSHEPMQKPLSGVVNAVAQQVSPAAVADPFALEQSVETSAAGPIKPREAHTLASVNVSQELDPFGEPSLLASHQVPLAEATAVAPIPAQQWRSVGSEIAFIIGLAVGLSAGLLVWLRSRLRKAHVSNV